MIVLQNFGFKESKYERPQDAWVCGRLADGKPCDLGPGLDGRCRVSTVCQPRLENDRWQCRRSASAGGPCEAGPLPDGQCCMTLERCVPRPSLRTKRKRSTLAAVALMVGILAVAMGGEGARHFMMPGKLSSHHAGLTDCSTCHAGARSGQIDLLHRLVTTVEPRQNSNLCVTCHAMGAEPFAPHTHPVEDLKRLTETLRRQPGNAPSESLTQRIAFPAAAARPAAENEIHCATCHKEHQGVFADLKTVSNQRCQTCHVSRFGSFADSHPEFGKFPYQRRPRIIFDHQSHLAKYFLPENLKRDNPGQLAPDCADCHRPGAEQRYMGVRSFAPTCSGCHDSDITGKNRISGPKGIGVIAVPGLDLATLRKRGIDIGGWPEDSEADVTPFMRPLLQLSGQDVVSPVARLKLLDLRDATDQELARVAALAWAVKRLFNTLKVANPAATRMPAGNDSKRQMALQELAALTGGLPRDVILLGSQDWFPNLQDDLQRHERGEPTSGFKPPAKATAAPAKPSPPSSAPTNLPGADILAPAPSAGNKDDILGPSNADAILAPSNKDAVPGTGDKSAILAPNDSNAILAPGDKDAILTPNKDNTFPADKPDVGNVLSGDKGGDVVHGATPGKVDTNRVTCAGKSADATTDAESWALTGGWYREDCSIRYRPAGHADPFLKTWLDFAGPAYSAGGHNQLAPIFDELAKRDASNDPIGRCTKCHSVDDQAGAKLVNWRPFDANTINNRFTNYSHKPHVELIGTGTKTCTKCHGLQDTESGFLKSYEGGDPVSYTPNFKHLDKAVCAACHSQQTAWESCTLCHDYHVPDVNSSSPAPVLAVNLEHPAMSAAAPTAAPPDLEESVRRDYAMAEQAGTKQAWDDFLANYPSGRYHEMAIEQIAKLNPAAPDKAENVTPDLSRPAAPAGNSAPGAVEQPAATADKPPAIPPDAPASPAPTKSVSANANEPTDQDGLFQRGLQRAFAGDFELAIRDFNEVIRLNPQHAGALNDRCWSLAMLDEVQAALSDCDAALRVAPNFSDAFDSRGLVNLKLGFYKEAIADYNSALSRDPKRASALYGRGIAKRRSGKAAGAKADIDAAKRVQPKIVDEFARYGIQ